MRLRQDIARAVPVLALTAALAAGCQQRQAVEEESGLDTTAATPTAPPPPAAAVAPDTAAAGAEISVTNTMPHEMVVTARWGEPEVERVLGPVGASETRTFELAAPSGSAVALVARDAGNTHGVEGSVTASADSAAAWSIQ